MAEAILYCTPVKLVVVVTLWVCNPILGNQSGTVCPRLRAEQSRAQQQSGVPVPVGHARHTSAVADNLALRLD